MGPFCCLASALRQVACQDAAKSPDFLAVHWSIPSAGHETRHPDDDTSIPVRNLELIRVVEGEAVNRQGPRHGTRVQVGNET